jgi:DMSO/TMAO reductase YedYZ heme-binding membrane subunit
MSKNPWHLRKFRGLIYIAIALSAISIALASMYDASDAAHVWIEARQLYGLWALALLLASMLPGPLCFVLPWIPFKGHLMLGRRALGISAFAMAVLHASSYLGPVLYRDWHDLLVQGWFWVAGLGIGLVILACMLVLAVTSTNRAVRSMTPKRWKQWQRSVYWILPAALLHATFVGTDFGLRKGSDVNGQVDAGCLVAMLSITLVWLSLFLLRRRHLRWVPPVLMKWKAAHRG